MNRESPTRYEHPNTTPVEIPFGFTYESLADTIGRMVRQENLKIEAKKEYLESFAESQDFDDDEPELTSPHEMTEMQDEYPIEAFENGPQADIKPPADPEPDPVAPAAPAASE